MADKKIIYEVIGSTGTFDDYKHWSVCAFTNKAQAEYHSLKCKDESDRIINKIHELREPTFMYDNLVALNKVEPHALDKSFKCEDSLTNYSVVPVELVGE